MIRLLIEVTCDTWEDDPESGYSRALIKGETYEEVYRKLYRHPWACDILSDCTQRDWWSNPEGETRKGCYGAGGRKGLVELVADTGSELDGTTVNLFRDDSSWKEYLSETERTEEDGRTAYELGDKSLGAIYSHYDIHGVYTPDGKKIGSTCGCIDYPCCGH